MERKEAERGVGSGQRTRILCVGRLVLFLHAHQRHGDLLEEALDVVPRLGGRLHEHDVELCRFGVRFF